MRHINSQSGYSISGKRTCVHAANSKSQSSQVLILLPYLSLTYLRLSIRARVQRGAHCLRRHLQGEPRLRRGRGAVRQQSAREAAGEFRLWV